MPEQKTIFGDWDEHLEPDDEELLQKYEEREWMRRSRSTPDERARKADLVRRRLAFTYSGKQEQLL